jgi:hypothetical protein
MDNWNVNSRPQILASVGIGSFLAEIDGDALQH